jgi:hypothetical protein
MDPIRWMNLVMAYAIFAILMLFGVGIGLHCHASL